MMRRVAMMTAVALAATASAAAARPKIEWISKTTYEFKTVYAGTPVAYGFFFKNTGDSTLVIEKVEKTCGCTTAKAVPEKIAPGQKGKISVVFDTGRYKDKQYKTVTVHTNDPDNEKVPLALSGSVKVAAEIQPSSYVIFEKVGPKEKHTRTITVVPTEDVKTFKILKMTPAANYVRLGNVRRSSKQKGAYDVDVTLGPNVPLGPLNMEFEIRINNPRQPVVLGQVYADVVENPG
jgi:archaellum component FlaG (FlaF/FlaG flagellin family)